MIGRHRDRAFEARRTLEPSAATAPDSRIRRYCRLGPSDIENTPALLPSVDDDVARVEQLDQAARWASAAQSERRVARLVAQGMTNRAVAEVLYVSKHTVDSHLKRLFVKLEFGPESS